MNPREQYTFYDDHLRRFGIDASVDSCDQLSASQRLEAASHGVGLPLLSLWITGRKRSDTPA